MNRVRRPRPAAWAIALALAVPGAWPNAGGAPRSTSQQEKSGRLGIAQLRDVRIPRGPAVDAFHRQRLIETLSLEIEPTPLVLRRADGPARRIDLRTVADGKPEPVDGGLAGTFGATGRRASVRPSDFTGGAYTVLVPEPAEPAELRITLDTALGKRLEAASTVKPARKWTLFITPHVHYDIGYTDRQPIVIERLARDMDTVVKYCEQTDDWPPESRFRWTVEVSALMRNYIERRTEAEVARFLDWVRKGRIEVCGYYLNMPTEVVGHEELIRCLYYARELRRKYGIRIDTAMIHDVPGYTWALPGLFLEAGIPRVSLCANTIRGKFTWDRPDGVPRPFYWEGPDGRRLFVWHTPNYGDAHFYRSPGTHEDDILRVIRANEARGYTLDEIQLGTANDNAPPPLAVSENTRAWNEKYLWPRIRVATNREFLEQAESGGGARCQTLRGDIPSWWADGPASSAFENGMVRLLHDQLTATEALWTTAWLADPSVGYPREAINAAYDQMIHFDEHTWGARGAASHPTSEETQAQWKWKAAYAYEAKKRADALHRDVLARLSAAVRAPAPQSVAVWNTLAWPRTDVVTLPLAGTPLEGAAAVTVTDARTKQVIPAQVSADGKDAVFIAREVPGIGHAVFSVARAADGTANAPAPAPDGAIENAFYRVVAAAECGGLSSWYDKRRRRELLDTKAEYRGNQPIYERSLDGREAITRKAPSRFQRTVPQAGKLVRRTAGPVFQEMVIETSLPSLPSIRQQVRLYAHLPVVDITNTVTKEEVFEPEGLYFAFPFDVPSPDIRVQIADAVMRPGKEQLPTSCQDYYSIQHWADVADRDGGVVLVPVEAPLVLFSGLTAYRWADRIDFNNGHVFSWVMNNYWYTNFRPGQSGTMPLRYRLMSYAGARDPDAITRLAWEPFHPLTPVWLTERPNGRVQPPESLIRLEGDPIIVSCIKTAETEEMIIVRLLEMRGQAARCTLRFTLPYGRRVAKAFLCSVIEERLEPLAVNSNTVTLTLQPWAVGTLGLLPEGH